MEVLTPRPNRSQERRRELISKIAHAFADLGYRRTTTAELAKRCRVQEVVLYRLWKDKRAMFIAAIEHVYDASMGIWERMLAGDAKQSAAERLVGYEATHHGEEGLYRIVFAGLSETDDPEIRGALGRMYVRYHEFIVRRLAEHGSGRKSPRREFAAWALIGMGTIGSVGRELGLIGPAERRGLWDEVGTLLLGPKKA